MMLAPDHFGDDIDDLPPLEHRPTKTRHDRHDKERPEYRRRTSSNVSGREIRPAEPKKEKKKVTLFNHRAEADARDLAEALSHSNPDVNMILDILPTLTHDQLMELRAEYKKVCKIQGRGINVAKHIKMKLPAPSPNTSAAHFRTIAYVTALGRWESEGYWANYWYQSQSAKRELLIEALMGRSNVEIGEIKMAFKDKRYADDLIRCMDKELKADKFRSAVLMALEERRQEENDVWPIEYRNRDVDTLHECLRRREGGESAMLGICVLRSDAHLREVLRTYERKYQANFAKQALAKSHNLVVSSLVIRSFPLTECSADNKFFIGRSDSPRPQRRHQPPRP